MRAVVFAYHNMGVLGIEKLLEHGFEIPLVFTYTDSAQENIWFASVADLCRERGIRYVTPESPNTEEWIALIRDTAPDIIFSFYYRSMITSEILDIPQLGAYNLHGSLLPAYRGRCPVNWVIIKGEDHTGVTLHEMVDKPDAGDIVSQARVPIAYEDTPMAVFGKMESAAADMLDAILPVIRKGKIPKKPQDLSRGSYFGGRKPEDGRIFWDRSSREIYNLIRGVTHPYPGAFGYLGDRKIIFWKVMEDTTEGLAPGRISVSGNRIIIGTGKGVLIPQEIEMGGSVFKGEEIKGLLEPCQGESMT